MGRKRSGHQTARLSDPQCKRAIREAMSEGQRRVLTDGRGLELVIDSGGSARWRQRIMIAGRRPPRRPEGGHGKYPLVGLSGARGKANAAYALAREGKNPFPKSRHFEGRDGATVADCVRAMFVRRMEAGKIRRGSDEPAVKLAQFAKHCPTLAATLISEATTEQAIAALKPLQCRADINRRVRDMLAGAGGYAAAEGFCEANPFIKNILADHLPVPRRSNNHQPALPWSKIGDALATMQAVMATPDHRRDVTTITLIILTGCRAVEAINAPWGEFEGLDGPAPLWRLPVARMKAGRKHTFPLSPQAARLLLDWAAETGADRSGGGFVFDFVRDASGKVNNHLARRMRCFYGINDPRFADQDNGKLPTVHGFRTTFSNWATHNAEWPDGLADAQLGHSKGAVADAYLRDGQEATRRLMMNAWGAEVAQQVEIAGGSLPGAGSMLERARRAVEAAKRDGKFDGFAYTG